MAKEILFNLEARDHLKKGVDGTKYLIMRQSDVLAVLG